MDFRASSNPLPTVGIWRNSQIIGLSVQHSNEKGPPPFFFFFFGPKEKKIPPPQKKFFFSYQFWSTGSWLEATFFYWSSLNGLDSFFYYVMKLAYSLILSVALSDEWVSFSSWSFLSVSLIRAYSFSMNWFSDSGKSFTMKICLKWVNSSR